MNYAEIYEMAANSLNPINKETEQRDTIGENMVAFTGVYNVHEFLQNKSRKVKTHIISNVQAAIALKSNDVVTFEDVLDVIAFDLVGTIHTYETLGRMGTPKQLLQECPAKVEKVYQKVREEVLNAYNVAFDVNVAV